MNKPSKTDWDRVKAEAAAGAPVVYDPLTDPYDPNDEAAVLALMSQAKVTVTRVGRPPLAIKRPTLNMRVDADIMEHLRGSGRGWQTRVNALLKNAVEKGLI